MNNYIIIGLVYFVYVVVTTSESKTYYQVPTLPPNSDRTTKKTLQCVCEDADQPVCASNGISYTSTCRFECAKRKVPRLRIVSPGTCGSGMTKQQYWSSGKKNSKNFKN